MLRRINTERRVIIRRLKWQGDMQDLIEERHQEEQELHLQQEEGKELVF